MKAHAAMAICCADGITVGRAGNGFIALVLGVMTFALLPCGAGAQSTPMAAATQAAPAAASTPRGSLLPLAQPLWNELTPVQRETLAPLEPAWNALPLAKKRSWLALTDKMPTMDPTERATAQARIQAWAALSPEQRRMARNNYRLAKTLDRDERLATWESYNQMTPEQRSVLRANGWTSNTAARHAGAPTGLAKEAARPITVSPTAARQISGSRSTQPAGGAMAPAPLKSPLPALPPTAPAAATTR